MNVRGIAVILAMMLLLGTACAAAEEIGVQLRDVHAVCQRAHPGYDIAAQYNCGNQIALILKQGEDNILCIAEWDDTLGDYVLTVDNTSAVHDGDELPSLLIDTGGDALFYIYRSGDHQATHYHSVKQDGVWGAVDSIHYEQYNDGAVKIGSTLAWVQDGMLRYEITTEDENGNPLTSRPLAPIPVSEGFEAAQTLDAFDIGAWDPDPVYGLNRLKAREGLMDDLVKEGETLLCADVQKDMHLLLIGRADGSRCLRVAHHIGDGDFYTLDSDVPADTTMDAYHTGDGEMILQREGGALRYGFTNCDNTMWALGWVQAEQDFSVMPHGVALANAQSWGRNEGYLYGVADWHSDTEIGIDFMNLPVSWSDAVSKMDQSGFALVNNPNPADRLHLRTQPKHSAESTGKYYNGTPVRILKRMGEWTKVEIGYGFYCHQGYMMSEYLAFTEAEKAKVACAFPQKQPRPQHEDGLKLMTTPDTKAGWAGDNRFTGGPSNFIVGVHGDKWYIVMLQNGAMGYVLQSECYDGNG